MFLKPFARVTVHGSNKQRSHLKKEKTDEVKRVTEPEWIVSHHLRHDNAGVDGVGCDTCRDIQENIKNDLDHYKFVIR